MVYKKKKINETTKQQYIWEKFLEALRGKIMFFKEHPGKNFWNRHWVSSVVRKTSFVIVFRKMLTSLKGSSSVL